MTGTGAGWTGVDLDGTLATYDQWQGPGHIGDPIAPMVERVKAWLAEGKDVRIFTARVSGLTDDTPPDETILVVGTIQKWCHVHLGRILPITCKKDYGMVELWDDRAVQVIVNEGLTVMEGHTCRGVA